ncbi:MAG: hypothetical protein NVSMB42_14470 [Herpetosiphon sp.]
MKANTNLRHYIGLLLHWSWIPVLIALVAGGTAYAVSSQQSPVYQASTTISIEEAPGVINSGSNYQSILSSERRALTYRELLTANPLLDAVIHSLNLPTTVDLLKRQIEVVSVRDTQLLRVNVRDQNPQKASMVANAIAKIFAEQRQQYQSARFASSETSLREQLTSLEQKIQQDEAAIKTLDQESATAHNDVAANDQVRRTHLENNITQYRQTYSNLVQSYEQVRMAKAQTTSTVVQEEPAEIPTRSVSPRVTLNTILATLLGLILGTIGVIAVDRFDDTVKNPDELSSEMGVPILGAIAEIRKGNKAGPVVDIEPRSPIAEAFRALRTNIEFSSVDKPLRTLLVTSPSPNEGKSTLVANLAAVIGQSDRRVIIVDADLRRPTAHRQFGLTNRVGLSELFVQPDLPFDETVRKTTIKNVSVITSGTIPPNPAELLGSQKMLDLLETAVGMADIVLIDTPPVNAVTDPAVLSSHVDGVMVVVRAGETKIRACKQAVEQLRRAGARVIGIVVNDVPLGRSGYGYAYQGYYYYYTAYGSDGVKTKASAKRSIFGLGRLFNRKSRADV